MLTNLGIAQSGPDVFSIMGLDPGSFTFGTALIYVDITSLQIRSANMQTFNAMDPTGGRQVNHWMLDTHAPRAMRFRELAWMLGQSLVINRPTVVACESPFFNPSNPNAYQVLVEGMKTVENALYAYDPTYPLYRIDNTSAKKAIMPTAPDAIEHLKSIKDSKLKVQFCVSIHPELSRLVNFNIHDEHSIDALIIGYTQLQRLRVGNYAISF